MWPTILPIRMKNKPEHAAPIRISLCQPSDPRWQALMLALEQELKQLYPEMPDLAELEQAQFLLAHADEGEQSTALGCIAMQGLTLHDAEILALDTNAKQIKPTDINRTPKLVEIKRLFVHPSMRGQGLAKRLLQALEALALQQQVSAIRLETGYLQHAAMALYRGLGYQPISAYGVYIGQSYSRCFEKRLKTAHSGEG